MDFFDEATEQLEVIDDAGEADEEEEDKIAE